jgi:hypothetical protein
MRTGCRDSAGPVDDRAVSQELGLGRSFQSRSFRTVVFRDTAAHRQVVPKKFGIEDRGHATGDEQVLL